MITTVIPPFLTFIAMFIGAGFISGSIVHLGEGVNLWDISLLCFGVILFVSGTLFQEIKSKGKQEPKELVSLLAYSLFLSLGIGMASGGIQHFVDTPSYSAILIPTGLSLGLIAFILKNRIALSSQQWKFLVTSTLSIALFTGLTLSVIARQIDPSGHSHAEGVSDDHHN